MGSARRAPRPRGARSSGAGNCGPRRVGPSIASRSRRRLRTRLRCWSRTPRASRSARWQRSRHPHTRGRDLAPHAPAGPVASIAAHERVVRGETVAPETVTHAAVLSRPAPVGAMGARVCDRDVLRRLVSKRPRRNHRAGVRWRFRRRGQLVDDPEVVDAARDARPYVDRRLRRPGTGTHRRRRRRECDRCARSAAKSGPRGSTPVRRWPARRGRARAAAGTAGGGAAQPVATSRGPCSARCSISKTMRCRPPPKSIGCVGSHGTHPTRPDGWVLRVAVEDVDAGLSWAIDALDPSSA